MKRLLLIALLLATASLTAASPAAAQPQWEFYPFAGYLFGGTIGGAQGELEIEESADYGLMVGIRLMEQLQLEISYARQETAVDFIPNDGSPREDLFDLGNNYLHLGVNYAIFQDKLTPFVSFGLGATNWNPKDSEASSRWQFSAVFGGGAKYYFSENFGIRTNIRIYSTFLTEQGALVCEPGKGCASTIESGTLMQVELAAGIILGF